MSEEKEKCEHGAIIPNLKGEGRCFVCNKFFTKEELKKWISEAND